MKDLHQIFTQNLTGRDFIVGDIHGNNKKLKRALESVRFNDSKDRIFLLGDFIDRGKDNLLILDNLYHKKNWNSILGNHENMILNRYELPPIKPLYNSTVKTRFEAAELHALNGGRWFDNLRNDSARLNIYKLISKLPIAMTLETSNGNLGLIHAEVPKHYTSDWNELIELLNKGHKTFISEALWGRNAILDGFNYVEGEYIEPGYAIERFISGIDGTIHGHTGVKEPVVVGNQLWMDTGYVSGELTIMESSQVLELIQSNHDIKDISLNN